MVSIEQLEALDLLVWLGSGERAAQVLHRSQPTISRQAKDCAHTFRTKLKKQGRNWITEGNTYLLELERSVHQLARLRGQRKIRAEINPWDNQLLQLKQLPHLQSGYCGDARPARALELLKDKVVDAYITRFGSSSRELCSEDPDIAVITLAQFQVSAMAHQDHEALRMKLTQPNQLHHHLIQCWPEGALPSFERHLKARGFWNGSRAMTTRDLLRDWEQSARQTEAISFDKVIPLSLHQQLQKVDLELGFTGEWALAIRKEACDTEVAAQLRAEICSALGQAKQQFPTLTII